ncbi:c-type cytochrome [Kaarinaea lacus]
MFNLKNSVSILITLILFTHSAAAQQSGQKIATQGNGKGATACIACHGVNGEGMAQSGFPRLAGLNAKYLKKQLHDLSGELRVSPVMSPIAKALSEDELTAVANYFAGLPVPGLKDQIPMSEEQRQVGKTLAEGGNWKNDVPACFTCHGKNAQGIGEHFPALAGQHASYIEQQLNAWRNEQRKNDPNELMRGIAVRLSQKEISAVSAYLASLAKPENKQ